MFRKLEINNLQSTNTYDHCKNIYDDTLLRKKADDLLRYFGIYMLEDNKRLPTIYWLPKLQNYPTKARFIIVAPT